MKKKDLMEFRAKSLKDLRKIAHDKKKESIKAGLKGGSLKLRREIAKILTLVREKEIIEKENKETVKNSK